MLGSWPARVTWVLLPFAVGAALGEALDGHSTAVRAVAAVLLWGGWVTGLVATLVPRTTSLTVYRSLAPAAVGVAAWALAAGASSTAGLVGLVFAAAALVVAFLPITGEIFADGSSYGAERRLLLRVPGPLLVGPLPITWLCGIGGIVAGPLLLAAQVWIVGAIALVVGWLLARWAFGRLHRLSRRWVVFVPAGLVLHDPLTTADALLLPRKLVRRLGPAPAGTDALDLTAGALGLALQAEFAEAIEVGLPRHHRGEPRDNVVTQRLLFTPTRPATLLAVAEERRLPVG